MRDAADTLHGRNDEIGPTNDKQSTADQEETKSDQLEHLLKKIKQNELELKGIKQLKEELKRMKEMGPYRIVGSIVLFMLFVYAATQGLNELRENGLKMNEQQDEIRAMNELLNSIQAMVVTKLEEQKLSFEGQLNALQEKVVKMDAYQKQQQRNIVALQKTVAALNNTISGIALFKAPV
ncbi:hypothetical protein GPALN_009666 [Globodera pallida]|nr:hypothetical protein GPALN_009666 [Globodera pallida]